MTRPAPITAVCVLLAALGSATLDAQEGPTPALVPVEVLPIDPALGSGVIDVAGTRWPSSRIAAQPVRIARGIVVEGRDRLLALTLLGELARKPDGTLDLDVP